MAHQQTIDALARYLFRTSTMIDLILMIVSAILDRKEWIVGFAKLEYCKKVEMTTCAPNVRVAKVAPLFFCGKLDE
jgi:hypothetical protein